MGAQQEDLLDVYWVSRRDVATSMGDKNGTFGFADLYDGESRSGSGDRCVGLSCAGEGEAGKGE